MRPIRFVRAAGIFCLALLTLAFLPGGDAFGAQFKPRANAIYEARVQRVVDGDTAILLFPDGQGRRRERVRFIGVNTPESVDPNRSVERYGREAGAFAKEVLTERRVWAQTDAGLRDKHGRLLAYIWLEEPGDPDSEQEIREKMFNARLLLEGYAQVMTVQPNSRHADLFVRFQREARRANKGLWAKNRPKK